LASKRLLALTVVARVLNRVPLRVGQERFETHINSDGGMLTRGGFRLGLWFGLTHDEEIPVSIHQIDQVCCLWRSFDGTMQFDLEGATQLLGDRHMLAICGKVEVRLMLAQLDGVPAIRLLEARKPDISTTQ